MQSTTLTTGGSIINGSPVKQCSHCTNTIHPKRLQRHPFTTLCARCQECVGDVEMVKDSFISSGYYIKDRERFGAIDTDEDTAGKIQPFVALTWNDLREPVDDTGTAHNTGLYVKPTNTRPPEHNHAS